MVDRRTARDNEPAINRWELTEAESHTLREYIGAMMLNGHVTAEAARLNVVDLYVLNVLDIAGEATAGELGRRTGLTSGAVTKLIDRLERSGLVRRHQDDADRRRVLVRIVSEAADSRLGGASAALFAPVASRLDALIAGFDPEQRNTLLAYFTAATIELTAATLEVQAWPRRR